MEPIYISDSSSDECIAISDDDDEDVQIISETPNPNKRLRLSVMAPSASTNAYASSACSVGNVQNHRDHFLHQKKNIYFANVEDVILPWQPCYILNESKVDANDENSPIIQENYTIQCVGQNNVITNVPFYHLANHKAPIQLLQPGTRVIARCLSNNFPRRLNQRSKYNSNEDTKFYAGIVGERISSQNKFRYLVFFDDGHVQYVEPYCIRKVFGEDRWRHVHLNAKKFMEYIFGANAGASDSNESDTATVRHRVPEVMDTIGVCMKVEFNGKWYFARMHDTDGTALIQMIFTKTLRMEWFYRGSPRLGPIWREMHRRTDLAKHVHDLDVSTVLETFSSDDDDADEYVAPHDQTVYLPNTLKIRRTWFKLHPEKLTENYRKPKNYAKHKCGPSCRPVESDNINEFSSLVRPLLAGWDRTASKSKRVVICYVTPCGKILRNIESVHSYLIQTESILTIDQFSFEQAVDCLRECKTTTNDFILRDDISNGLEKMPIRVVNQLTRNHPDQFTYISQNILTKNVPNYLNSNFMSTCDCQDDCRDKFTCSCWLLTLEGLKYSEESVEEFGYTYKRLLSTVTTGIFECNANCKCSKNCLNRVVQEPLQHKLELFKTKACGWGVRCLNDLPQGAFVSCYFGEILDDKHADQQGKKFGDTYLAQLNFIESSEQFKYGYESNVIDEMPIVNNNSQNDDECTGAESLEFSKQSTPPQVKEPIRSILNYFPTKANTPTEQTNETRSLFDKNEMEFVIDGNRRGNIGRFYNHSCDPNLFVQQVFVDTHDIRFPWLAFFTMCNIKAGTELTWNYNYTVDSIPGRELYCKCGSKHCVGRLL